MHRLLHQRRSAWHYRVSGASLGAALVSTCATQERYLPCRTANASLRAWRICRSWLNRLDSS
jgi:hypothetical protein